MRLVFASLGFRVLFRNEWECCMTDEELERYERSHLPLVALRTSALRDFVALANP
jgi:hypothetical protein